MSKSPSSKPKKGNSYTKLSGLAFELLGILLVFIGGGYWLDQSIGVSTPWFTILGTFLALVGMFAHLFRKLS